MDDLLLKGYTRSTEQLIFSSGDNLFILPGNVNSQSLRLVKIASLYIAKSLIVDNPSKNATFAL